MDNKNSTNETPINGGIGGGGLEITIGNICTKCLLLERAGEQKTLDLKEYGPLLLSPLPLVGTISQ